MNQCCGSGLILPDPKKSDPYPGHPKIPDPDPLRFVSIILRRKEKHFFIISYQIKTSSDALNSRQIIMCSNLYFDNSI